MIQGQQDLQKAYQDPVVASEYVRQRFESPLGALLHERQVRVVRRVIDTHGIREAIEIAPGPARVTVDVAARLDRLTLVDVSMEMLREAQTRLRARRLAGANLLRADAFALPLRARAQLVYSFRLIRHFERADRLRVYRQAHDVLTPGGWLIFDAVNAAVSLPLRARAAPGEYRHFDAMLTADDVRTELQEAGFYAIELIGVQRRYAFLSRCQNVLAPRSRRLARAIMEIADRTGGSPLEWIVVCRRV